MHPSSKLPAFIGVAEGFVVPQEEDVAVLETEELRINTMHFRDFKQIVPNLLVSRIVAYESRIVDTVGIQQGHSILLTRVDFSIEGLISDENE
jgi:hypothetical protein